MLSARVIFLKLMLLRCADLSSMHFLSSKSVQGRANRAVFTLNVRRLLTINTTSCLWQHDNCAPHLGSITRHRFSHRSLNHGPYNYSICHVKFHFRVNISSSAVVKLTGHNSLSISSTQTIIVSSNIIVEKTSPLPHSTMWLGGFCSGPEDMGNGRGAGPGGGCINGGAGHGGMGIPFIRHKGVLYGWSYGFNTSHIELTGGSSGGWKRRGSGITCGGGAITISSLQRVIVDATISTNAYNSLFNHSCIGGSSGGTIVITAKEVILTSNAKLTSKGSLGSLTCSLGGGSGGVIAINGTVQGFKPDPHSSTGVGSALSENGVVIINGVSERRLPKGINSGDYAGCFIGNKTFKIPNVLVDYQIRPKVCKDACRDRNMKYSVLHEKLCGCLDGLEKFANASESMCNLRCFGNYNFYCGGENNGQIFYSVYKIQPSIKPNTHSVLATTFISTSPRPTTKPHNESKSTNVPGRGNSEKEVNVSEKLGTLSTVPITLNNSGEIVEALRNFTNDIFVWSPSDLNSSLSIFERIINHEAISTTNVNESKRIGQNVLAIADRLLSNGSLESWNVLEKKENKTPEILLKHVEGILTFLGNGMKVNETLNLNSTKFGAYVEVVDPRNFRERNYTFFGLHIQTDVTNRKHGEATKNENLFIPTTLVESVEGEATFSLNLLKHQSSSTLVTATLEENRVARSSLASDIIAISLSRSLSRELKDSVLLSFPRTRDSDKASRKSCRFLNFNGSGRTVWSRRGCKMSADLEGNVKCSCNHFTHFAVLLQVDDVQVDSVHVKALHWITFLGCAVSLICLVLTLMTFVFLRSFTSDHTTIHCNLVVSLTSAQIGFLLGIKTSERKIACKITAILLHYFYTAAMCWMCVEGIHLYRKVVKVFIKTSGRKFYYIFGWGTPAFVVSLSALSRWDGYGSEKACWLSMDNGLIWAFIAPVLIVITINLVVFLFVIRVMLITVHTIPSSEQTSNVRAGIKGIIFLLPILGFTWVFGVLAVNSAAVIFQYIFTILNSLQGFFIFMFHCVLNSEVRVALRRRQQKSTVRRTLNDSWSKNKSHNRSERSKTLTLKRPLNVTNVRTSSELSVVKT